MSCVWSSPGEDLARLGGGLQPRGRVHHGPGHQQLARGPDPGRGLTRLDPDADLERLGQARACARSAASGPRMASPARTARTASSSWTCGRPKTAMTASPMNFSGWPRSVMQLLGRGVVEHAQDLPGPFRVEPLREARRIDQVGEQHRDHLSLLGPERGRHGEPQFGQNRAPSGSGSPQTAQFIADKHR